MIRNVCKSVVDVWQITSTVQTNFINIEFSRKIHVQFIFRLEYKNVSIHRHTLLVRERKKNLNKEIESNAECQYFKCSVYKTTKNCSIENVLFNRRLQNCTMEFDELKTTAIRMNGTATAATTKARKEPKKNYYLWH